MESVTFFGRSYPVLGSIYVKSLGQTVPLVDIRVMDAERERELAKASAKEGVALWTKE